MITPIYSILHMLVDGICAFAMFGKFVNESLGYEAFLIYNFCAFALQMPFGALLDSLALKRKNNNSMLCAILGVIVTILGALVHPAILGIGNALFHVGAGVSVIREDNAHGWKGQALGIFVAPGAFGLFLGTQFANSGVGSPLAMFVLAIVVFAILILSKVEPKQCAIVHFSAKDRGTSVLMICCFLVVILRSYVGMAVSFEWKTTMLASALGVMAVVLGKMAGGILAARIGIKKAIVGSLVLAAISYGFSGQMVFGVLALFLFNMTMPITLYLLVSKWENLPGFSFGLLTFGLFLGFLPVYMEWSLPIAGRIIGVTGSIISLVILIIGVLHSEGKGWWKA